MPRLQDLLSPAKKVIFAALILLLPTQLALHFWPSFAHIQGIRIDYYAPTIFLTDTLIVLLVLSETSKIITFLGKHKTIFVVVLLYTLVNTYNSPIPQVTILKWIKLAELLLLARFIVINKYLLSKKYFILPLLIALAYSLGIGVLQTINSTTTGGVFQLLGERSFNIQTPGISKFTFFDHQLLRAYSTFPHPNAFAGFSALALFILISCGAKKCSINKISYLIVGTILLITQSTAAIGTFLLAILLKGFLQLRNVIDTIGNTLTIKKLIVMFVLFNLLFLAVDTSRFVIQSDSINQRIQLMQVAKNIALSEPSSLLFGFGGNSYIYLLPHYSGSTPFNWILQPVHNVYILIFIEYGLIGIFSLAFLLIKSIDSILKNNTHLVVPLLVILITSSADHYWFTLQQNMILVTIALTIFLVKPRLIK